MTATQPIYTAESTFIGTVAFRELKTDDEVTRCERVFFYRWTYHTTGGTGEKRIAVVGGAKEFLALLDRWNGGQPGTWSYHSV